LVYGVVTLEEFPVREPYPPDKSEELRKELPRKCQVSKLLPRYFLDRITGLT